MKIIMKKTIIILTSIFLFGFASCTDNSTTDSVKKCYTFHLHSEITSRPSQSGYPQYKSSTITKCDLTSKEAINLMSSYSSTSTTTSGGYTITTKTTCWYD